jgi:hypothetical protein
LGYSIAAVILRKDLFKRNRRGRLKQALSEASDYELQTLRNEVSLRQEEVAQLELEFFDTRADLTVFEREMEDRLGLLKRQIKRLEDKLETAKRQAARRAQWGDRADSPDIPEDVVDQFRKTWRRQEKDASPHPLERKVDEATKEELKTLYRNLAKRFHPDLAIDPEEKAWREERMAEVNAAYAEMDMTALEALVGKSDWAPKPSVRSRDEEVAELRAEIKRLDELIEDLERNLRELINSDTVKLMLEVSSARRAGWDLLGKMENDLLARISALQHELSTYS